MKEQVAHFGSGDGLYGILAHPSEKITRGGETTAFLLLNAGILHRVGAHRLNVKLARLFAQKGFPALRFDLSGLGDSPAVRDARGFEQQVVCDISAAIDFVQKTTGAQRVIAVGMCSGADNIYRAVQNEARICGAVLLDPFAYSNKGARVENMAARLTDVDRWRRFGQKILKGDNADGKESAQAVDLGALSQADQLPGPDHGDASEDETPDADRGAPPRKVFGQTLQGLTTGGLKVNMIYTNYVQQQLTKRAHFESTFGEFNFGDNLELEVWADVDHTYTELNSQQRLFDRLSAWADEHWPAA